MDKAKWIKAGLEIAEPLKEIQSIAAKYNLDCICIGVFGNEEEPSHATFIDGSQFDDDTVHYEVEVHKGKASLSADQDKYYIQT